jgi:hypothetical protein
VGIAGYRRRWCSAFDFRFDNLGAEKAENLHPEFSGLSVRLGTQVDFWTFTYPNQAADNWTMLLTQWLELRDKWGYSHAVSAGSNLIALVTLILSAVLKDD